MPYEYVVWVLLILVLVFFLGWVAARIDMRKISAQEKQNTDLYFQGLNFLLDEQPDQAISAFVEVAKLDTETVELHFALGNLFRRRGEIERAIRIHQSLLSRSDLDAESRLQALYDIACDYMKAGMYQHAEEAFTSVLDSHYEIKAAKQLIRIYEIVHDWPCAIEMVQRYSRASKQPVPQLVHYYCEMQELDRAQEALVDAHSEVAQARVLLLQAQKGARESDWQAAQHFYRLLVEKNPLYVSLCTTPFMQAFEATQEREVGLELLKTAYQKAPNVTLFKALFQLMSDQPQEASRFAQEALATHPTLLGFNETLQFSLQQGMLDQSPVDLGAFQKLLAKHLRQLDRHRCCVCGFQAKVFYWQCPGCNQWETYSPLKVEESSR